MRLNSFLPLTINSSTRRKLEFYAKRTKLKNQGLRGTLGNKLRVIYIYFITSLRFKESVVVVPESSSPI